MLWSSIWRILGRNAIERVCRQEARKLRARLTEERVVFEREEEAVSALAIEGDGSEPITADES